MPNCWAWTRDPSTSLGMTWDNMASISFTGVDDPNAILAHQHGGMRVEHEIAGDIRHLGKDFSRDMAMPVGFGQDAKLRRGKERIEEKPCMRWRAGPCQHSRVCDCPEKLVYNAPGDVRNHTNAFRPILLSAAEPQYFGQPCRLYWGRLHALECCV